LLFASEMSSRGAIHRDRPAVFPDEVLPEGALREGAVYQVLVNA